MINKKRLHFSAIFENIFAAVIVIGLLLISSLDDIVVNIMNGLDTKYTNVNLIGIFIALGIIILAFLLAFIFFYIRWRNTYVYFQDEMFVVEKGKLITHKVTIKLKDISNINIRRNIFEKIIGTCSLKLDLNTMSDTNLTTKLIFKMDDALAIKNYILNNEVVKEISETSEESMLKFSFTDVIKHCLMSINLVNLLLVLLVYIPFVGLLLNEFSLVSIVFILVTIIPIIWNMISKCLGYLNFKLINNNDHLTLTYGFFTTVTYHVYFDKVNALIINQTLQARIFKKYLIEVVNAGMGNDDNEKQILTLYTDKKTVDYIMENLLNDYVVYDNELRQDKKALLTMILNNIFIWIVIIVLGLFVSKYFWLLIILGLLGIILSYYTKKITVGNNLVITNGIFNKKTTIIKYSKIEQLEIKKGLFARLFNLNNLQVSIIGTALNTRFKTGYFDYKIGNKVVDKLIMEN